MRRFDLTRLVVICGQLSLLALVIAIPFSLALLFSDAVGELRVQIRRSISDIAASTTSAVTEWVTIAGSFKLAALFRSSQAAGEPLTYKIHNSTTLTESDGTAKTWFACLVGPIVRVGWNAMAADPRTRVVALMLSALASAAGFAAFQA